MRSAVVLVDRYPVLAGADLEVSSGELLALVGPNGAGKTSVLRLLAGLSKLHSGQATVLGHDLKTKARSVRSQVGYAGHDPFAYGELTVHENLSFLVRRAGKAAVDVAIERVGLVDRRDVRVSRLSAGQRRRLGIAALIARDAQLWLLDEPHTGLDSDAAPVLDAILTDAIGQGRTVIFSSHDAAAVERLATRSVTVRGGMIEAVTHVS